MKWLFLLGKNASKKSCKILFQNVSVYSLHALPSSSELVSSWQCEFWGCMIKIPPSSSVSLLFSRTLRGPSVKSIFYFMPTVPIRNTSDFFIRNTEVEVKAPLHNFASFIHSSKSLPFSSEYIAELSNRGISGVSFPHRCTRCFTIHHHLTPVVRTAWQNDWQTLITAVDIYRWKQKAEKDIPNQTIFYMIMFRGIQQTAFNSGLLH